MTTHELARQLLALPSMPVIVRAAKYDDHIREVGHGYWNGECLTARPSEELERVVVLHSESPEPV